MLKLDRLEVSGFKSFVDPVTVEFSGGITAIVGPNGCGKSNISDAMTWVLGEQSAKTLRGSTMEDVIFNGSENRKPLGMAEVNLTFKTDSSFAAADHGAVTLGRRFHRSGEGQYRLNGKLVRLKEIKDHLMDTGLGIRAYSVIEQGKIGMILSGKPQERRKLIEEAAGVTRYKARRRIAELKLEEASANLLRLDDILSELERSLRSLKRQANAARRFRQKKEEYRELLETVLLARWHKLKGELDGLSGKLETAMSDDAAVAANLHRDEAELAVGREEQEELARIVSERHKARADLAATIEGRQEFLRGAKQRLQETAERAGSGRTMAERKTEEVANNDKRLVELEVRAEELRGERRQAAEAVDRDREQTSSAEQELAEAQKAVEAIRAEMLTAVSEINRLRDRAHQSQIELEKATYRQKHLTDEQTEQAEELAQATEALGAAEGRVSNLESTVKKRRAELADLVQRLDATMKKEAEAAEAVNASETALRQARQRQTLLEELSRAHAERLSGLEEALEAAGLASPVYLSDRVKPIEGWEHSLDLYLAEMTDAIVLEDTGLEGSDLGALAVAESLDGKAGAQLITPLSSAPSERRHAALDDADVVLSIAEALNLSPELAAALPPAFLAETAQAAERLAREHRGAAFLAPDGLWFQGGVLHVEGARNQPGVLERERELKTLGKEIPKLEKALDKARIDLGRLVEQRSEQAAEQNRLDAAISQTSQELAVALARKEDATVRHRRLAAESERLAAEAAEIDGIIEKLTTEQSRLETERREAEERHTSVEGRYESAAASIESAQERRESLKELSAGRRGRLEVLEERLESQEREIARIRQEITESQRQIQLWQDEAERLTGRQGELTHDIAEAEGVLQDALERRAASDDELRVAQERLEAKRTALRSTEERVRALRNDHETRRGVIEGLKVEQAQVQQNVAHLVETFKEEFEIEPSQVPPKTVGDIDSDDETDQETRSLAEMEDDLAKTRQILERLGPVNELAVDEYAEQEERHGFLTEQRSDVADSVSSLKQTIREINEASVDRLTSAFAQVNETFGNVFQRLFRGGEAEMRWMDEEDILESGIEIVARPPGKKLQNLLLLSGGEKALTAVALLFALFQTKPSPFCILDEVDAPLDDVNTVRFVELLREMSKDTQFLVITHNKITMEAAGTLYGVTMEERGVSKLVAVEMDRVQPEARAATA